MMVNTSIDSGAAPVSYLNEEYLIARDRSDGMSSIIYRKVTTDDTKKSSTNKRAMASETCNEFGFNFSLVTQLANKMFKRKLSFPILFHSEANPSPKIVILSPTLICVLQFRSEQSGHIMLSRKIYCVKSGGAMASTRRLRC